MLDRDNIVVIYPGKFFKPEKKRDTVFRLFVLSTGRFLDSKVCTDSKQARKELWESNGKIRDFLSKEYNKSFKLKFLEDINVSKQELDRRGSENFNY